jgi:hypothetical protein
MPTMGQLMDTLERLMAAVAFAESNDRETACWIMKSKVQPKSKRPANRKKVKLQSDNRPQMRL